MVLVQWICRSVYGLPVQGVLRAVEMQCAQVAQEEQARLRTVSDRFGRLPPEFGEDAGARPLGVVEVEALVAGGVGHSQRVFLPARRRAGQKSVAAPSEGASS
jgi:hypothetical protein